ncbi:type IV secretion system DNA-binding domain-containing protein [Neobacillus drentensis]|uniref:type IV secretion system DNA-binding domain-containing protein n=1 Tax=Neobacillus drentensis TaxID=220684 RepID=UPI002FFFC7F9
MGPQQSTQLRTAIMEAYKRKGIEPHLPTFPDKVDEYPTFMDVHNILLEDDKKHGTLLGRMDLLFQLNLFRKETKLSFEELMSGSYTLRLSQLPMNEIKAAIAEMIILAIHNYLLSQEQPRKLTRAVVLDEAHRVSQSNALLELMREGRSFGIGMMIATQFPTDIGQGIYGCTETKLFLSNDQFIHAEAAAKQIEGGSTRQEINELAEGIRNMKQFRAVLRNSQYPKVFLDVMPYYKRD